MATRDEHVREGGARWQNGRFHFPKINRMCRMSRQDLSCQDKTCHVMS